jgi:hypothetical protein
MDELGLIVDFIKWIFGLSPFWALLGALLGAYMGAQYGLKQLKLQKKLDFIERQLREFYSPLLGCHKELQAKSELRLRINNAVDEALEGLSEPSENHETKFKQYEKLTEYDHEQLRNELLPLYHKMLLIFRDNLWLAEPEDREWYPELCNFVEIWDRRLLNSIPPKVIAKIGHTEERLKLFYQDLEKQIDVLQNKLLGNS